MIYSSSLYSVVELICNTTEPTNPEFLIYITVVKIDREEEKESKKRGGGIEKEWFKNV